MIIVHRKKKDDRIANEENKKEYIIKPEDNLKENDENNELYNLMNNEPEKNYLNENLEEISSDEDKISFEKEKEN